MDNLLILNDILDNIFINNLNYLNYNLEKENDNGNIEYKRTLLTYTSDNKKNKLIRQIFWRISEGLLIRNEKCCFFIIGIEDNGSLSNLNKFDLINNNIIINSIIKNTNIKSTNKIIFYKNKQILLTRFYLDKNDNFIQYF